jgi:hypothetical protein
MHGIFSIYDAIGRRRIDAQNTTESKTIDIRELPRGPYVIELVDNGKGCAKTFCQRIIRASDWIMECSVSGLAAQCSINALHRKVQH